MNGKNLFDKQNRSPTFLEQTVCSSDLDMNRTMTSFPADFSRTRDEQEVSPGIINETTSAARSLKSRQPIQVVGVEQLTGEIASAWNGLRSQQPQKESPYFAIEFTQAVAAIRDDVQIAIFRDADGEIDAFLPFQKTSASLLEPIGGRLNDVHGILGGRNLTSQQILAGLSSMGIRSASFHAAADFHGSDERFQFRELQTHHLDLSDGWDAYYRWAKKNSTTIKRHGQKSRAMARRHGEIRFEFQNADPAVLEELIALKRAKYQRTKTFDILSVEWAADLLRRIHQVQTDEFSGILSTLHVGDRLVAAHFGMLTDQMLHYWFPTFDVEFNQFSPGTELLLRVAKECCNRNLGKLDLGFGDDEYKFRFSNGNDRVSCGLMTDSKIGFQAAKTRYFLRQRLKSMPLKPAVKRVLRKVYPGFGGWNFK